MYIMYRYTLHYHEIWKVAKLKTRQSLRRTIQCLPNFPDITECTETITALNTCNPANKEENKFIYYT